MFSLLSMLRTDLRIDSSFCFVIHLLISFYNRGGKCLQRGTDWCLIQCVPLVTEPVTEVFRDFPQL